ncbi:MAG: hypothetical protein Q9227_007314 [Pyrenula ochraceoflavens]
MAAEAMEQEFYLKNPDAKIRQLSLRDISIGQALVLKSGMTNLEIVLASRPQTYSAKKFSKTWQEFRIFTVSNDNIWTEHCRGRMQVVLHSNLAHTDMITTRTKLAPHPQKISPKMFYYLPKDMDLDWDTPFDNLKEISTSKGSSVSIVSSAAVEKISLGPHGPMYTVHPAILDSCLYHSLYAILLFEDRFTEPIVPTFIKRLTISAQQPGRSVNEFVCHARRAEIFLSFDVGVFEKGSEDNVVLQAWGISTTRLPGLTTISESTRDLCHAIDWVTYMPEVTHKHIDRICKSTLQNDSMLAQNQRLDALTLHYIQRALQSTSDKDVPEGWRNHWFHWMKAFAPSKVDHAILDSASADDSVGAQALKRLGPKLPELLRGSVHPLNLLTDGVLLGRMYTEERCLRCYEQISAYFGEFGKQNPDMKVLEIGAGTASALLPVLEALKSFGKLLASEYRFTDISPGFFQAAQDKLREFDGVVSYKVLNVEHEPTSQGFEIGAYDLILACNSYMLLHRSIWS